MKTQTEIYNILKEWINYSKQNSFSREFNEKFNHFRDKFGKLEIQTFGKVSQRIKNPIAMQCDKIRNYLVRYSGEMNVDDLISAEKNFLKLNIH